MHKRVKVFNTVVQKVISFDPGLVKILPTNSEHAAEKSWNFLQQILSVYKKVLDFEMWAMLFNQNKQN